MLTVREIQAILKVSRATIWAWMRRRVDPMPSFKLGTALRFRRSEVERWVQKQRPVYAFRGARCGR